MSLDKMHDETLEKGSGSEQLEAGFSDDGKAAKKLLFKMDIRYICVLFSTRFLPFNSVALTMTASCLFSRSSSCARSSTVQMSVMRRY
jgi:hypothetical protein